MSKWLLLEKDGDQQFFNNKFNFWFLLGLAIPLVIIIDTATKRLFLRLIIYVICFWILALTFVVELHSFSPFGIIYSLLLVFLTIPMGGHAVTNVYPQEIFLLIGFHYAFMFFHLFTRKGAILGLRVKEGWKVLGSSSERKEKAAILDFNRQGLTRSF